MLPSCSLVCGCLRISMGSCSCDLVLQQINDMCCDQAHTSQGCWVRGCTVNFAVVNPGFTFGIVGIRFNWFACCWSCCLSLLPRQLPYQQVADVMLNGITLEFFLHGLGFDKTSSTLACVPYMLKPVDDKKSMCACFSEQEQVKFSTAFRSQYVWDEFCLNCIWHWW